MSVSANLYALRKRMGELYGCIHVIGLSIANALQPVKQVTIKNKVSIEKRPGIVNSGEDMAIAGHEYIGK